jgi:SpoVK/Ycf46/Vps4 family AAA+-type ATPase
MATNSTSSIIDAASLQNPTQYIVNHAIASSLSQVINKFVKSKNKFSKDNLINIAMILGLDEFKKIFNSLLTNTTEKIKNIKYMEYLQKLWKLLSNITKLGAVFKFINIYKYIWRNKKVEIAVEQDECKSDQRIIEYYPSELFWTVLYMYITSKNDITYENNVLIEQLNKEEYNIQFSYMKMKIEYENCEFIIDDVTFDVKYKDRDISKINGRININESEMKYIYNDEFTSLFNFIPNKNVREAIVENFQAVYSDITIMLKSSRSQYYNYLGKFNDDGKCTSSINISSDTYLPCLMDLLLNKCKRNQSLKSQEIHVLYAELAFILSFAGRLNETMYYDLSRDYNREFGYTQLKNLKSVSFLGLNITSIIAKKIPFDYNCDTFKYVHSAQMKEYRSYMNKWIRDQLFESKYKDKGNLLNVLINTKDIGYDLAVNKWCEFITKFEDDGRNKCQKVKVFYLTLQKNIEYEEIDNPEYINWKEQFDMTKSLIDDDSDNEVESKTEENKSEKKIMKKKKFTMPKSYYGHMYQPMPDKKIKIEKIIKTVHKDEINDIYKNFDTLYLREEFTVKLKSMITQFRDRRADIESLGLRYKFCALLYGEPGTGKSSTILAVASFLNKNVYYVNMKNIETNEDMQLLFDYVNKNCMDSGIIVMEDIDAMTSVVHCRKEAMVETTTSNLIDSKSGVLTLEYMLNLLDGTLTKDGLIFFATTNHLERLDPAFKRPGRFEILIRLDKADHYQINKIYNRFFGEDMNKKILERIPENVYTPAAIINSLQCYILNRENDELMFKDFLSVNDSWSESSESSMI